MPLVLFHSDRFARHETPPGHPERVERAVVMSAVAARWRERGGAVLEPRKATREELARVHAAGYLDRIAATAGRNVSLDPDTHTSSDSHEVALVAAGAAVSAVQRVLEAPGAAAFALVRPPGHHAEREHAMGFCLYNNIAVAAAHARAAGIERVVIVDYDVHHGNGTQHMFESDPNVLYLSLHQFPFYPGTGDNDEIGRGPGAGFTVNVPMAAGSGDGDYREAWMRVVSPVLDQFAPELVLVSAGFDADARDPLANMRLSTAAFGAMTTELRSVADTHASGRLVLLTEGGYDLSALEEGLESAIDALAGTSIEWPSEAATHRGLSAVDRAVRALLPFWKID
jgi:acetoin utilization deacetylase AcuC-like enzyme